ncbi:MAG: tRNA dihydrouridine synthase DusB [Lentimicrobiaceae bacterium]|nr:tRNA dihydrouridine synthase DusB [Lentimicrobiaceae bacterium]
MLKLGNLNFEGTPLFLAPMEDVTDSAFRWICKEFGVDVLTSEFASSEALIRNIEQTKCKLKFTSEERPFGIQLFGNKADAMCEAARLAEQYNPDFIDINWGCPVKKIAGKGAGSGIFQNIPLMIDITQQVVKAVKIPVTVKTRLGWDDNNKPIAETAERLQDVGIQLLTIHGRTKAAMYSGKSDWTLIGKVKENPHMYIPIVGNGDVADAEKAVEVKQRYHVDGIMIGRGAVGNPWIFPACKTALENGIIPPPPSIAERLRVCRKHLQLALQEKGEHYGMVSLKKHYKSYFKDIENFKELRIKLLTTNSIDEIWTIFNKIEECYCK